MKQEKIKLLWQAHEGNLSGANIALLEYMDALAGEFSFFVILPQQGTMGEALEQRGIPYAIVHQYGWTHVYPWWSLVKWMKLLVRSIAAVWQTKQLLQNEKPAIVCTNTLVPFTASVAAKWQHIPHVWWIHEFGKEDFGFTPGWGHEKIAWWWMQQSSKLIIGNSRAIGAKFQKLMPKVMVKTVYQPVSWNGALTGVTVTLARFLMFGQIVASKGHKEVLQAMAVLKKHGKPVPALHIKGPCETKNYLAELQQFVQQNGLQSYVQIEAGYFTKEAVLPLYEVLIVASRAEAFGRVIVEANKAGLRVLVRNSGGAPELVNESNGLLFSNQEELAGALCGERVFPATKNIRSNYSEAAEIKILIELLYTVCGQNNPCLQ